MGGRRFVSDNSALLGRPLSIFDGSLKPSAKKKLGDTYYISVIAPSTPRFFFFFALSTFLDTSVCAQAPPAPATDDGVKRVYLLDEGNKDMKVQLGGRTCGRLHSVGLQAVPT